MKISRLIDDFDFKLKDEAFCRRHRLPFPCVIKISEIFISYSNWDGYYKSQVKSMNFKVADTTGTNLTEDNNSFHLELKPGMVSGLGDLYNLVDKQNLPHSDRKQVFQEIRMFGLKKRIKIHNESKPVQTRSRETQYHKYNDKEFDTYMQRKIKGNKGSFENLSEDAFDKMITLSNGERIIVRISTIEYIGTEVLEPLSVFLKEDLEKFLNKKGRKKTTLFLLSGGSLSKPYMGTSIPFYKGSIKGLDDLFNQLLKKKG